MRQLIPFLPLQILDHMKFSNVATIVFIKVKYYLVGASSGADTPQGKHPLRTCCPDTPLTRHTLHTTPPIPHPLYTTPIPPL